MATGTCINSTDEDLLVYGPKIDGSPFDNSLYLLPTGMKTPASWDCDGIYVPSDRVAIQLVGANKQGPVAVKFGLQIVDYTFTITKDGTGYRMPANQGVFSPTETCRPSNYPTCVNWEIPSISQGQVSSYPHVPNAVKA